MQQSGAVLKTEQPARNMQPLHYFANMALRLICWFASVNLANINQFQMKYTMDWENVNEKLFMAQEKSFEIFCDIFCFRIFLHRAAICCWWWSDDDRNNSVVWENAKGGLFLAKKIGFITCGDFFCCCFERMPRKKSFWPKKNSMKVCMIWLWER